jgi:hypothetical protein
MVAPTYPVRCECGATLQVPGAAAGTTRTCRCGRAVEVPTLARLKTSVGEATVSADLELEHLVAAGALPLEQECVTCGRQTSHCAVVSVVCERPEETGHVPLWQQVLLFTVSLWLYVLQMMTKRTEVHGRNVAFQLPVRVCPGCAEGLTTKAAVRDVLTRTPVYERLLGKYPHAQVTLVSR